MERLADSRGQVTTPGWSTRWRNKAQVVRHGRAGGMMDYVECRVIGTDPFSQSFVLECAGSNNRIFGDLIPLLD